jgi:hypothetical protein
MGGKKVLGGGGGKKVLGINPRGGVGGGGEINPRGGKPPHLMHQNNNRGVFPHNSIIMSVPTSKHRTGQLPSKLG